MRIMSYIWQLPQNLLGLLLVVITRARKVGDHYEWDIRGSISLGDYIMLGVASWENEVTLRHERGHQVQSRMLGWLYLPVVGLPSLVWNACFRKYREKHNVSYYSFYTEKWADKLSGIERT